MHSPTAGDREKVEAFLEVIRQRVVTPIENGVGSSCTATLLLLFAAIDGLGCLLCKTEEESRSNNKRLAAFLIRMGTPYAENAPKLADLRHSLSHSAMNVAAFMSALEEDYRVTQPVLVVDGLLYVNTQSMFTAFQTAYEDYRREVLSNVDLLRLAASRLEWHYVPDPSPFAREGEGPVPTKAAPVGIPRTVCGHRG
jgi:hypothetical protein